MTTEAATAPEAAIDPDGRRVPIHGPEAFEAMDRAGRLAALTLDFITPHVAPGAVTADLDRTIDRFMREHGGTPATLGYKGYPASSCISINHVVNHGIPGERRLRDGDIVNIDVAVILDGWHGDTSRMYLVGETTGVKARRLVDVTFDALMAGIAEVAPGKHLGDVGHAIQRVAEAARFSVVRDFVGHGVGRAFHEAPQVHHVGRRGQGLRLRPGMIFTVEPMINAGRKEVKILADGWTTVTRDRQPSAQFEHTVGVTEEGARIFTLSPAGYTKPPYPPARGVTETPEMN